MGYLGNQITTVFPTSISVDSATISGNTTVGGTLGVTGATTLSNTLGVTGVSTLSDNIVFGASGKGVHLGVTSATASNLIDDYEEGTWTPSVGGDTTYNTQRGRYVKIGSQVTLWFFLQINQRNSVGVPYIVGGSPFTNSSAVAGSGLIHYFQSIQNSAVVLTCRIDTGGANINVSGATGSATTVANVNHDWVGNGSEVFGFVTHYVGS